MTWFLRSRATAVFVAVLGTVLVGMVPAHAASAQSVLTVRVTWAPGLTDTWTLRCDPVGGSHPNRTRACALLDGLADPFSTAPTGLACTMIYSGPERARVVGTWRGAPVDARFTRTDGCATARWRMYRPLFTEPGVITVRGRVDLGPTCPVQRPDEICEITGAAATVSATDGVMVRTASSGPDGFSMRVHRARWTFTADAGMSCPEVFVDARPGHVTDPVVIACDTGIRVGTRAP